MGLFGVCFFRGGWLSVQDGGYRCGAWLLAVFVSSRFIIYGVWGILVWVCSFFGGIEKLKRRFGKTGDLFI